MWDVQYNSLIVIAQLWPCVGKKWRELPELQKDQRLKPGINDLIGRGLKVSKPPNPWAQLFSSLAVVFRLLQLLCFFSVLIPNFCSRLQIPLLSLSVKIRILQFYFFSLVALCSHAVTSSEASKIKSGTGVTDNRCGWQTLLPAPQSALKASLLIAEYCLSASIVTDWQ